MAWPCLATGLMSSSTACDSGIREAPNRPCNRRNKTISNRLVAAPHSIEAMVKPTIEIRNRSLRPIRPDSQPVIGVMIAAATMYDVSTQVICSWDAETLPWMCGRATFAMVVSSAFIRVASMIEIVIGSRAICSDFGATTPAAVVEVMARASSARPRGRQLLLRT